VHIIGLIRIAPNIMTAIGIANIIADMIPNIISKIMMIPKILQAM
jgi:hypothetical protein